MSDTDHSPDIQNNTHTLDDVNNQNVDSSENSDSTLIMSMHTGVFPFDGLCTCIWDGIIHERILHLRTTEERLDIDMQLHQCLRFWKHDRLYQHNLLSEHFMLPFLKTKGQSALTHGMGRMWPEDFMMLKPGDDVIMLISPGHDLFFGGSHEVTGFIGLDKELMEDLMWAEPLQPHIVGSNMYFAVRLTVSINRYYEGFNEGRFDRDDVLNILNPVSSAGVEFYAEASNSVGKDVRQESLTILFSNIHQNPDNIMFWKEDFKFQNRMDDVTECLEDINDVETLTAYQEVFSEYLFGDALQSYAMLIALKTKFAEMET